MKISTTRRQCVMVLAAGAASSTILSAHFSGLKLPGLGKSGAAAAKVPMNSGDFIKYLTVATGLGVQGSLHLTELYPPEAISEIKALSEKFNEAQKIRTNEETDTTFVKAGSFMMAAMEKLTAEVTSFDEVKRKALGAAHHKITLMMIAEGFAVLNFPAFISQLQSDVVTAVTDRSKLALLKKQLQFIVLASTELPKQIKSAIAVRGVVKKIAAAQKTTLPDDPKPESINTLESLNKATAEDLPAAG